MKCYLLMYLQRLVEDIEYVDLLHKAAGKGIQHNLGIKTTCFLYIPRLYRYYGNIVLLSCLLSQPVGYNA